jgi:outer membrane protein OmpA-like peptidoglycan-associated protein
VADRAQQVAIPAPVAELLAAWNDRSADRFVAILAPDACVAVPPLHLELAGRDDVWLGVARVFGAFGALRYVSRHRYLTPESVTDEAILEGLQTQEFLGAPPPGRPGAVAARVIIRHDGAVVTNLEVWPDVAALRELFDGVARRIDLRSAGAAGPVVAALRATIPSPEGKLSVGQQRQERQERQQPASFEEALVGGAADSSGAGGRGGRSGGREPGHANHQPGQQPGHHGSGQEPGKGKPKAEVPKAPLPRRVRMVRALLAGAVMLVVAGLLVTYVVVGVRNKQEPVAASKPRPSASATHKPRASSTPRPSAAAETRPTFDPKTNTFNFTNHVLFETDQYTLRPQAKQALDLVVAALVAQKRYGAIAVTGYTDSTGSEAHNLTLSRRRALVVARYLQQGLRNDRFQVTSQGLGEAHPVDSNATQGGREQNRRVEIKVPDPQKS